MDVNQYAAPVAPTTTIANLDVPARGGVKYAPLGVLRMLATIGIGSVAVLNVVADVAQIAFVNELKLAGKPGQNLPLLIGLGLVGLAVFAALLLSAVAYTFWIYRAASNLRAFGREGMEMSPGMSAGGFFIPFANLVFPYRAMSEVWRGSDPNSDPFAWKHKPAPAMATVWWFAYLFGGALAWAGNAGGESDAARMIALVAGGLHVIAAVCIILLMKEVGERQVESARILATTGG